MSGLNMKYFVLKPKGTDAYAKASRAAMNQFSKMIREENPELANDLLDWQMNEFESANSPKDEVNPLTTQR